MTTDAGELMALAELRFFRDLVDVERMKVFKAFGVLSQEHDEFLTHGVQRQLFKQLCLFPSIAASQPDREAVARALARAQSETALTAYDAGAGLAVSYWNMQADAILSLLSVQVDGEQASLLEQSRIAPLANEDQIKHMVNRFLMWKLPESFSPDCGISFKKTFNDHRPQPMKNEPIGTNLFDAQQADAMVRYMLEGLPPVAETDADAPGDAGLVGGKEK